MAIAHAIRLLPVTTTFTSEQIMHFINSYGHKLNIEKLESILRCNDITLQCFINLNNDVHTMIN